GQVFAELADPPVVAEVLLHDLAAPLVAQVQCQPGHQERGLPSPAGELLPVHLGTLDEDLAVRPEGDLAAGRAALALADLGQLSALGELRLRAVTGEGAGHPTTEGHPPHRGAARHTYVQP